MKKVLYIGKYNGIIGGIERYMQKSAELLRNHGFAVHYLYMENGGREQERFASVFDSIAEFSPENPLVSAADIILIHNIIAPEYLKDLPEQKIFFFAHDHNIYCRRHHYYMPVGRINCHRKYCKYICRLCSLGRNEAPLLAEYRKFPALVLSDFMRDNLLKNGFEKVVKIPAFIQCAATDRQFMPDGVLRILFLGQLIRGKGADLMIETLARLNIPFDCTVAGDGKDRKMLEMQVEKFNLGDKVHFAGFVSEPEKLWKNCDLFFFPIRWQEPFGLVALEALAHGVPVAAFDLGGVREYLSPDCGVLIPEKDIAGAAEALQQLYQKPEVLKAMGQNGALMVEKRFSNEAFIEKFKEITGMLK